MTPEPAAARPRRTKRNVLFASVVVVVIFAGLLVWFVLNRTSPIPAGFPPELSREDLKQIQQAVRRDMWQKTGLPSFSWHALKGSLPRLLLLATTSIRKIELARSDGLDFRERLCDCALVDTQSPFGDCTFILARARDRKRPWFRLQQVAAPGRPFPGFSPLVTPLFTFRIGTSPGDVYTLTINGTSKSLTVGPPSVPDVSLSLFPHSNFLATNQPPVLSEPDFATSLSNQSSIMLAH